MHKTLLTIALACAALIAPAWAAGLEINLGIVTTPGSAQWVAAERFKTLLEAETKGRVTVVIHHSASLGDETQILGKIQAGSVEMGVITLGPFDEFAPQVRVVNYPFLFKDADQAHRVLDGAPGQALLTDLEEAGFKGLAFSENGFRHLTTRDRPVTQARDVEGLSIRVMESELHMALWKMLGARPKALGWPINADLEKGVVTAQENPLWVAWVYKLYELQKYLILTGHVYSAHIDVANLAWFNGLDPVLQKAITRSMRAAARYQRQWNQENEAGFLAKLKAQGMNVIEHPDKASFRAKTAGMDASPLYAGEETRRLLRLFKQAAAQ